MIFKYFLSTQSMLWLIVLILLILIVWIAIVYNKFITMKNAIESTFNQIRVAMKKRFDKIGKLVETSKSFIKYEKNVLTDITKLRSMPLNSPEDLEKAAKKVNALMGSIRVAVENYPDLKSQETVVKLMNEISSVEDEIARLRYLYNDQVQTFNTMAERIPSNIVAALFGFSKKPYLRFGEEIEKPVDTSVY